MNTTFIALLIASTSLLGACNTDRPASTDVASQPAATGAEGSTAAASALTPEQLGELGALIEKQPDRAKELLSEKGLTEKSFEMEIRKVTENADSSKRYAEAYKKAKA